MNICPNLKNKEVAKEFNELLEATSENAAYHIWSENNGHGIDKAPNGEPSKLFTDLLDHYSSNKPNNRFKPGDVVFGHPAIGKSHSFEKGKYANQFIDWDVEFNVKRDKWIEKHSNTTKGTPEFKKAKNEYLIYPENHKDYQEFITSEWVRVKKKVKKENKILFASPSTLLKMFPEDFTHIINMSDEDFVKRNIGRGDNETNSRLWKEGINAAISEIKDLPVLDIKPGEYLEDLLSNNPTARTLAIQTKAKTFSNSFKTWFGDWTKPGDLVNNSVSKVVDNNGEPLMVYHRSSDNIVDFSTYKSKKYSPSYFSVIPYNEYGDHQTTAYLSIKNPDYTDVETTMDITDHSLKSKIDKGFDGMVGLNNILPENSNLWDSNDTMEILIFDPNQVKSIDNQGSFSTESNVIYEQRNADPIEVVSSGRNEKLQNILTKLYPEIELGSLESTTLRGQAVVSGFRAGKVLINALSENQDTLPHEYAHHYISWFRNHDTVKEGIAMFGTEEALVQAIGENATKAIVWYKKLYTSIKALFNKRQATLNKLTDSFLSDEKLSEVREKIDENHFQKVTQQSSIDPVKLSNILKIDDTYKRLITALTLRVKDVKNAANLDIRERQSIELHLQLINNLEASQALIQYIPLMQNDIASTVTKINELNDKLLQAQATGETIDIPATVLLDIKRGFLGFYSDVITSMQDVLEDVNSVDYLTNKGISAKDLQIYKDDLVRIASDYHNINRKYENLVTYQATNNIINYAKERGSTTVELLRRNILFSDKDIGIAERFVYSPIHSQDEVLTQVADRLVGAKNATERSVLSKGKKLVGLTDGLSRSEVQSLFEKTKDGKKTAYLVRPLNHGEYQMNKVAKQTALANEYGLQDIYERPQDRKQLVEYNRKMNEWYDANAERRYTKDYYDLFNNLSPEASSARESVQMEIRMIYHDVTDNKGNVHLEDLTSTQWGNLLALSKQKRDLANPYNLDGTAKIGTDKDVAAEIAKLNEALKGNVKYKVDLPAFREAYLTAKRTLTEEKLLKWVTRNTVKVVKQEFYDALARLAEPKSEEYEALKTERNNLQKLYKTEDGSIDADFMPNSVKARLVEINTKMSEMMEFETTSNPEKSKLFNKVAKVIVNEGYSVAWDLAASQGDDVLANWLSLNTYQAQYKDGTSGVRPASFWTQVVPVDEKMYTHKPSAQWSTIEESSNFVNPNFDHTSKEFSIPKKSKYDNSMAYDKVRNNAKLSKLYNGVYDMLNESNGMLDFIHKTDNYRLPQIEANSLETIGKANSIKEGISTSLQNALAIRDTDTEYEGASPAVRSDGSYVKLIPTRYLKALDDPNTITDDIVGATIAYYSMALNHKNMRKIEPEMNLIIAQMGKRTTEGGEPGNEMKVYKRAIELMDMHMYGKRRQRGKNDEFTVFGKKISKSKLAFGFASFLRLSTLSHNINVIATGLITNKMNTRIEALSGEYFDSSTLAKAAKEVAFSYPSMIASLGKVNTTNKLSAFMEYNQVVFNNAEMFNNLHKSRVARTLQKHFWYGGHTMVDYSTKGRLTAAIYFSYKLVGDKFMNFSEFRTNNKELGKKELNKKWHGLTTTLYDAYELSGETITIKKEHANRVSSILEDRVKNTIQMIGSRIDGQLSDIDRASIHTNCYAAFFVMFRNFMIQMIQTRFKSAHFNYSKGNWDEGYYRATANYISRHVFNKEKLTQLKELCDNFDELDQMERTAVERVASEMLINLLMFTVMSHILSAFADDDKRDWTKQEMAYLATRARLELSTPYNPLDLMNMLQNPTAAVPYLNTVMTLGELVLNPSDEVKSGPYKGNTKLFKAAMKLTPGKMYYEALDPASKRRYLENQVMKGDFLGSLAKSATSSFREKE